MPDEVQGGITRREALRRGTMAGLGLVWVTPKMASFSMTAQYAQATSPVPETTQPEVGGTVIESTPTTQPAEAGKKVEDEVLSKELPFTGLPLEQLLPLAGGAVATGAAAVRMAREKKESKSSE